MDALKRLEDLTQLPRSVLQASELYRGCFERYGDQHGTCPLQGLVRDCMRETLAAMAPGLNISQRQLLGEFERLFPEPASAKSTQLPAPAAQPQLMFQHECRCVLYNSIISAMRYAQFTSTCLQLSLSAALQLHQSNTRNDS